MVLVHETSFDGALQLCEDFDWTDKRMDRRSRDYMLTHREA